METMHTETPYRLEKSTVANYTGFDIFCNRSNNKKWIASVHGETLTGNESAVLAEKKRKSIAEAEATAKFIVRACNTRNDLVYVLVQAIEHAGFSVSGPTDVRAAEDGEPAWVCNARAAIAEATGSAA